VHHRYQTYCIPVFRTLWLPGMDHAASPPTSGTRELKKKESRGTISAGENLSSGFGSEARIGWPDTTQCV